MQHWMEHIQATPNHSQIEIASTNKQYTQIQTERRIGAEKGGKVDEDGL